MSAVIEMRFKYKRHSLTFYAVYVLFLNYLLKRERERLICRDLASAGSLSNELKSPGGRNNESGNTQSSSPGVARAQELEPLSTLWKCDLFFAPLSLCVYKGTFPCPLFIYCL